MKIDINELKMATKKDINELKIDINELRMAAKEDINELRTATKEDINELKIEIEKVRTEMERTRSDIIKWMFLFWIGQLASLIAILQIFFRK